MSNESDQTNPLLSPDWYVIWLLWK